MPRSRNPRDFSLHLIQVLISLSDESPPALRIPTPNERHAHALRREFYSLKRALREWLEKRPKRQLKTEEDKAFHREYEDCYNTLCGYQMTVLPATATGTGPVLEFVSRDETELMKALSSGFQNAERGAPLSDGKGSQPRDPNRIGKKKPNPKTEITFQTFMPQTTPTPKPEPLKSKSERQGEKALDESLQHILKEKKRILLGEE